jgi:hypothetical protein
MNWELKLLISCLLAFCCQHFIAEAPAQDRVVAQIGAPDAARVQYWESILPVRPRGVGPNIADRTAWESIAARPKYHALITEADDFSQESFPPLPDSLFLEYSQTGRRESCERRIRERMRVFTTLVYAECMENKGRFLKSIESALSDFDRQKTWLYPAHDPELNNFRGMQTDIAICSSTQAWNIATAVWWLGEKLSPASRRLVAENLERRIFTPFEDLVKTGKPKRRWILNTANHNSVTTAGVIGCAMAQIELPARRAYFVASGEKFIQNYLSGFTSDGFCAEGVGYWNYGFGRFVMFAETLRQASGNKIDLLADDHVRAIAEFGRRSEIQHGLFPSYSDCSPNVKANPELVSFLSSRYGWQLREWVGEATQQARVPRTDLFMMGIFDRDPPGKRPRPPHDAQLSLRDYFPEGGLLICRPTHDSRDALAVAIRGGHNAEPHNHNDAGSYQVVLGDEAVVVDPGAEVYTSRTFTGRRYESNVVNSFGHSVPRVGDTLQSEGLRACAKILQADFALSRDVLRMDLASAYDVPGISRLERTFTFNRRGDCELEVVDDFAFEHPQKFETALITFAPWHEESARYVSARETSPSQ